MSSPAGTGVVALFSYFLNQQRRGADDGDRFSSAPARSIQGDRHGMESVIGMAESVIGMGRNLQWQAKSPRAWLMAESIQCTRTRRDCGG